jgi:hypothetical protein
MKSTRMLLRQRQLLQLGQEARLTMMRMMMKMVMIPNQAVNTGSLIRKNTIIEARKINPDLVEEQAE